MVGALTVALASAGFFAAGSSLQHRSAESAPSSSKVGMLATLARRPGWLIGALLCAVAFGLHATALRLGDLSLVQPVILSGIVFTVVARAALDRRPPSRAELVWAGLTWAGLALFIAMLRPGPPREIETTTALAMVGVGLVLVVSLIVLARITDRPLARGMMLGAGAGILFGLVAGLLKLSTMEADRGLVHLVTQWPPWALLAVGAWAVLLNQRAYQATRLSVSMPVLNIFQLLVALAFGFIVFDERLFSSPARLAAELVGLVAMGLGVTKLASRAADQPDQRDEPEPDEQADQRERDDADADADADDQQRT